MTPAAIIEQAAADGVKLSLNAAGSIKAIGETEAINRWLSVIRDTKSGIIAALQEAAPAIPVLRPKLDAVSSIPNHAANARSERVLAMLDRSPGIKYTLITDTKSDPEDVILTVGIRDIGTAELRIPKAKYAPFTIMKAVETLQ